MSNAKPSAPHDGSLGSDRPRGARRGRPALDPELRRERILAAASSLFIAKGFGATSVDAISRDAGVTKRTIYELIGDKEAVFHTVCVELYTQLGHFEFDAPICDLTLRQIFTAMAHSLLTHALSEDALAIGRVVFAEARRIPHVIVGMMEASRQQLSSSIANVFADLMSEGRIASVVPFRTAEVFYDIVIGNRTLRAMQGYNEPPYAEDELQERIEMFIRGYLRAQ